jgi:hypothetical protein
MQHLKKLLGGHSERGDIEDMVKPVYMVDHTLKSDVTAGWSVQGIQQRTAKLVAVSMEDSVCADHIVAFANEQLALLK